MAASKPSATPSMIWRSRVQMVTLVGLSDCGKQVSNGSFLAIHWDWQLAKTLGFGSGAGTAGFGPLCQTGMPLPALCR